MKIRALTAGDSLVLAAGTYDDPNDAPGLPIFNPNGTASAPIPITGTDDATGLFCRAARRTKPFASATVLM